MLTSASNIVPLPSPCWCLFIFRGQIRKLHLQWSLQRLGQAPIIVFIASKCLLVFIPIVLKPCLQLALHMVGTPHIFLKWMLLPLLSPSQSSPYGFFGFNTVFFFDVTHLIQHCWTYLLGANASPKPLQLLGYEDRCWHPHGGYLFASVQPNTASSPLSTKEEWASKALLWLASITKHKGLVFCPSPLTSSLFYNILKYALLSDNLNSLLFLLLFPKSPYVQILTIFKV